MKMEEIKYLPAALLSRLPTILQEGLIPFTSPIEKEVVLISMLTTYSALFPTISGPYKRDTVHANFFTWVIAPPASMKGVAKYGTYVADKVQAYLASSVPEDNFENVYDNLFLPGNISATFLFKKIKQHERLGNMIFESEADTMANAMRHEWGVALSDMLRRFFHHERCSLGRGKDELLLEILHPKLSILFTSTPSQLGGIVKSIEDGLLSRFLIYYFDQTTDWEDVSPGDYPDMKKIFEPIADNTLSMYQHFRDGEYEFVLGKELWAKHNEQFDRLLKKHRLQYGDLADPFVKRCGLIAYRITMVLSILHYYERGSKERHISAPAYIHGIAVYIAAYFLANSLKNLGVLTSVSEESILNFLKLLPSEFARHEAVTIATKNGLSERTIGNYLNKGVKLKLLAQPRYGFYKKSSAK